MKSEKDATIIYYTENTESEDLEKIIRVILRKNSGKLPIISVSRKPIKFGKNICVGTDDVPICESTVQRMILKGLLATKTKFAILAAPNCLYPPDYFTFTPTTPEKELYYYTNNWALGDKFWQRGFSNTAFVCNRKYWIQQIQNALRGHRGWKPFDLPPVFTQPIQNTWTSENPTILIKTPNSLRRFPSVLRNVLPKRALPFWGTASELKTKLGI